jgi:FkbM family methyltransferase
MLTKKNLKITRYDYFKKLESQYWPKPPIDLKLLHALGYSSADSLVQDLANCKSQFGQDLVALSLSGFKRNGFFVEFGATDGIIKSNTYLLEKHYGWRGILAEPSKSHQAALRINRDAFIDSRCVWRETGALLEFNEFGDLSTIASFTDLGEHAESRRDGLRYEVSTVSLNDLLEQNNAPLEIDFLSIDTEGSEHEILKAFDFSRYQIDLIICEHNGEPARSRIKKLLESNNYERIWPAWSGNDDFYVSRLHRCKGEIKVLGSG